MNVYDNPEDEDFLPWTSVRKGNLVGMIDTTGTVRIPVRFSFENRAQIVFQQTEKGEVAPARDAKTGKWGLIDRKGKWLLKPTCRSLDWDTEQNCLIYTDDNGQEHQLTAYTQN